MPKGKHTYSPIEIEASENVQNTALNTARMIVAAGGGSAVGAIFGVLSIPVGIATTAYSIHKGKSDGLAFGLGMITGGAYKTGGDLSGMQGAEDIYGMEGMDGFSFQAMMNGAKLRLKNWLSINKSRVMMKKSVVPPKGKVGSLFMDGLGETYLLGEEDMVGNTEELIGDTTEMTISSIGNVHATPEGNLMLGYNSVGGII